ncbi:DUF5686 and carboxypeptidase regulatory-like domain-containing protein [Geofilum sp. OHC36d9]|uniref:DUF5686 and carboxypeptidase regulatory-like domain-containing protein n=1 Tax=Geofilum sp. OHC36d9 TaxID=3458413 RepID=UPI004033B0BF
MKTIPSARLIHLSLLLLVSTMTQGAVLHGTITDKEKNPIPGVSLFIRELRTGTISNNEGNYEITLPAGTYHLTFQSLGMRSQDHTISITEEETAELNIELESVHFKIDEVKVYSGGEDPAYAMMRKAISLAPYYLRQAKRYDANVYLKGSLQVKKVPRLLRKNMDIRVNDSKIEVGPIYTIESMNEITFVAPDTFRHTVISSQSNFQNNMDENSPIGYINSSFYSPENENYISPLSPQAMRHYKYRYEGYIKEGNIIVNKIKVIPRRKSQQLFSGDLYLVDGLWNIYSVDFNLTTFFGDIHFKQVYAPLNKEIWLPVNQLFEINAAIMGLAADAQYVAAVEYTHIEKDEKLTVPPLIENLKNVDSEQEQETPTLSKTEQKIAKIIEKEDLNNRDMMRLAALTEKKAKEHKKEKPVMEIKGSYDISIRKDSLKRDSLYWQTVRPIPLTAIEAEALSKHANRPEAATDSSIADTIKQKSRFSKTRKAIMSGTEFPKDGDAKFSYKGLFNLSAIGFNAVDGWKYHQEIKFSWKQDSLHTLQIEAKGGYAFNRKSFFGNISIQQNYAPLNRGLLTLTAATGSRSYKRERDVAPLLNMASSLLFKENYLRLYNDDFVALQNEIDITNGLRFTVGASYHDFSPLNNSTNFSFFKQNNDYHPNTIINKNDNNQFFEAQNAFITKVSLAYTPLYYYRIEKGRKEMLQSDYPTFHVSAEHATGWFDTDNDYLLLEAGAFKESDLMMRPALSWNVNIGKFVRNEQVHFSRFRHFAGSQIPVVFGDPARQLMLKDSYLTSTNNWYMRGNVTYSSPWLLLKRLPLLSQTIWNENIHLSYLNSDVTPHYLQTGYSISRIFMLINAGIYAGFSNGEYTNWGLRISIDL